MGEARRRRIAAANAGLARAFDEGGGLVSVELFVPVDLPGLLRRAQYDRRAQRRLSAIASAFQLLRHRPPPQCLLCPADITNTDALGAVVICAGDDSAAGTEPRQAVCNHVCSACADRFDRDALHQAVVNYYAQNVSNIRVLDGITPPPERNQ